MTLLVARRLNERCASGVNVFDEPGPPTIPANRTATDTLSTGPAPTPSPQGVPHMGLMRAAANPRETDASQNDRHAEVAGHLASLEWPVLDGRLVLHNFVVRGAKLRNRPGIPRASGRFTGHRGWPAVTCLASNRWRGFGRSSVIAVAALHTKPTQTVGAETTPGSAPPGWSIPAVTCSVAQSTHWICMR